VKGAGVGFTFIHFPPDSTAGIDQLLRLDVGLQDLTTPVVLVWARDRRLIPALAGSTGWSLNKLSTTHRRDFAA
jgi:hypothetical protein